MGILPQTPLAYEVRDLSLCHEHPPIPRQTIICRESRVWDKGGVFSTFHGRTSCWPPFLANELGSNSVLKIGAGIMRHGKHSIVSKSFWATWYHPECLECHQAQTGWSSKNNFKLFLPVLSASVPRCDVSATGKGVSSSRGPLGSVFVWPSYNSISTIEEALNGLGKAASLSSVIHLVL